MSNPSPNEGADKEKVVKKSGKIVLNCDNSQYSIVRDAAKQLGWRVAKRGSEEPWDVFWSDTNLGTGMPQKLNPIQKTNHFPSMWDLSRKDRLASNLGALQRMMPEAVDFIPETWVLPGEYEALNSAMDAARKTKAKTFICKPKAGCQGKGIKLIQPPLRIPAGEQWVVSRYIDPPALIDGFKFDIRLYVLVKSMDPLVIYIFDNGLVRLCTKQYKAPTAANISKTHMHLTNFAINKGSKEYDNDDDETAGHKRSLKWYLEFLREEGHDVDKLWEEIGIMINKSLLAVQPQGAAAYNSYYGDWHNSRKNVGGSGCFEVLGFDIMLDSDLKPWLIEVNASPSFSGGTTLDDECKLAVLKGSFEMMGINPKEKRVMAKRVREDWEKRLWNTSGFKQKEKKMAEDKAKADAEAKKKANPTQTSSVSAKYRNVKSRLTAGAAAGGSKIAAAAAAAMAQKQQTEMAAKLHQTQAFMANAGYADMNTAGTAVLSTSSEPLHFQHSNTVVSMEQTEVTGGPGGRMSLTKTSRTPTLGPSSAGSGGQQQQHGGGGGGGGAQDGMCPLDLPPQNQQFPGGGGGAGGHGFHGHNPLHSSRLLGKDEQASGQSSSRPMSARSGATLSDQPSLSSRLGGGSGYDSTTASDAGSVQSSVSSLQQHGQGGPAPEHGRRSGGAGGRGPAAGSGGGGTGGGGAGLRKPRAGSHRHRRAGSGGPSGPQDRMAEALNAAQPGLRRQYMAPKPVDQGSIAGGLAGLMQASKLVAPPPQSMAAPGSGMSIQSMRGGQGRGQGQGGGGGDGRSRAPGSYSSRIQSGRAGGGGGGGIPSGYASGGAGSTAHQMALAQAAAGGGGNGRSHSAATGRGGVSGAGGGSLEPPVGVYYHQPDDEEHCAAGVPFGVVGAPHVGSVSRSLSQQPAGAARAAYNAQDYADGVGVGDQGAGGGGGEVAAAPPPRQHHHQNSNPRMLYQGGSANRIPSQPSTVSQHTPSQLPMSVPTSHFKEAMRVKYPLPAGDVLAAQAYGAAPPTSSSSGYPPPTGHVCQPGQDGRGGAPPAGAPSLASLLKEDTEQLLSSATARTVSTDDQYGGVQDDTTDDTATEESEEDEEDEEDEEGEDADTVEEEDEEDPVVQLPPDVEEEEEEEESDDDDKWGIGFRAPRRDYRAIGKTAAREKAAALAKAGVPAVAAASPVAAPSGIPKGLSNTPKGLSNTPSKGLAGPLQSHLQQQKKKQQQQEQQEQPSTAAPLHSAEQGESAVAAAEDSDNDNQAEEEAEEEEEEEEEEENGVSFPKSASAAALPPSRSPSAMALPKAEVVPLDMEYCDSDLPEPAEGYGLIFPVKDHPLNYQYNAILKAARNNMTLIWGFGNGNKKTKAVRDAGKEGEGAAVAANAKPANHASHTKAAAAAQAAMAGGSSAAAARA